MHSCLYRGSVTHRRQTPVEHSFRYRLFWLYLDLDEWPDVTRQVRGLSAGRFAPAAFCRGDHLGDPATSLAEAIRGFVHQQSGRPLATGPIRLLTQPRSFGLYFSPLNLYYCFTPHETLAAVVAEVNNTPWGEQHCYLLWDGNCSGEGQYRHAKQFHVSPFMAMEQQYHWRVGLPGQHLAVQLATVRDGQPFFEAGMQLAQEPLTSRRLATNLARSPVNAARVMTAIYYQALRLWIKKCPYYPHPKTKSASAPAV